MLLPLDPDASAARIRGRLRELTARDVGVIVSDSFGRPWRQGTTDVAIGAAGLAVLRRPARHARSSGYELRSTQIAVADELAGAAELVMGKADGIPARRARARPARATATRASSSCPPSATSSAERRLDDQRPPPRALPARRRRAARAAPTRCSSRRVRPPRWSRASLRRGGDLDGAPVAGMRLAANEPSASSRRRAR